MLDMTATATTALAPLGITVRHIELVFGVCGPAVKATVGVPKSMGKRRGLALSIEALGRAFDLIPHVNVEIDAPVAKPRVRGTPHAA